MRVTVPEKGINLKVVVDLLKLLISNFLRLRLLHDPGVWQHIDVVAFLLRPVSDFIAALLILSLLLIHL